jgi:hypothetical protein
MILNLSIVNDGSGRGNLSSTSIVAPNHIMVDVVEAIHHDYQQKLDPLSRALPFRFENGSTLLDLEGPKIEDARHLHWYSVRSIG